MEERDGNYLARLEREGQTAKVAELRASLPTSHPHYYAKAVPKLGASAPSPASARAATSGGGAGTASAASPSLIEQAAKKANSGDLNGAIKLCDQAISANDADLAARRLRGESYLALYEKTRTKRSKQCYLEKAKADFEFCFTHDKFDEAADDKVKEIEDLLAQLASASLASSGSGAGASAGATAAPAPAAVPSYRDMSVMPANDLSSDASGPSYRGMSAMP